MDFSDLKWYLIGGGILAGAALLVFLLGIFAPEPEQKPPPEQSPLVSTTPVEVRSESLLVHGTGTVQPAREIQLTAEVSGRLVDVSDALVSGGRFTAGETLARVDPADYRSAVKQAEAQVTQANFQLIQAREEAASARRDYERIEERTGQAPTPDSTELGRLLFKEPQLEQAKANLESARAALSDAKTNLHRTGLRVPFNGIVRQKQADLGTHVVPGTPVATVFGTDVAEIVVSLPSQKAALIEDLWTSGQGPGEDPPATVRTSYGETEHTWTGYVHRVEGAINEQTRTVDVVVRVPNPYEMNGTGASEALRQPSEAERPPLAVGTYVEVGIEARREGTYHVVPRQAVRTRNPKQPPVVWTVEGDSMLVERTVEPIQTVEEQTYLAPTLDADARVITTDLRVHTDSMTVRITR